MIVVRVSPGVYEVTAKITDNEHVVCVTTERYECRGRRQAAQLFLEDMEFNGWEVIE